MQNNVLDVLVQAYAEHGYSSLRFNFRGTGESEGQHEKGLGEQLDLIAAIHFMRERGSTHLDLASGTSLSHEK